MTNKIHLYIISPEETLIDTYVDMVLLPGSLGEFGVLKGHENLISSLQVGILKFFNNESDPSMLIISGGFAEISAKYCYVLVDEAVNIRKIPSRLQNFKDRLSEINQQLDNASNSDNFLLIQQREFLKLIITQ